MKDLCRELDRRIAKLQRFGGRLQTKIERGINVPKNSESLKSVNNSLRYATDARKAMELSCCDFSCQYYLHHKNDEK
jgi:hypothetical protein